MWRDSDEARDIEPLNSDESFLAVEEASLLPVGLASPPLSDVINPALPKEIVMVSPWSSAIQGNVEFP